MISQILWLNAIIAGFAVAYFALVKFLSRNFDYWERLKLLHNKPLLGFGSIKGLLLGSINYTEFFFTSYWEGDGQRYYGLFIGSLPVLMIRDIELVRNVMDRHFEHFNSRGLDDDYQLDPMNNNLLLTKGPTWRFWRTNMASFFSHQKVQSLTSRVELVSEVLASNLELKQVDIRAATNDYAINIMGDLMVSFSQDQLNNPDSDLKQFMRNTFRNDWILHLRSTIRYICPYFPKLVGWKRFSRKDEAFFVNVVKNRFQHPDRDNYSDLLTHLICNQKVHEGVTLTELAANTYGMFAAGVETTGSVLAYTLYELARHQDIQDKLHNEMCTVLSGHNNEPTYAAIKEMKYLDQVLSEALRMYPSLQGTSRMCTKEYKIPDSDVVIEKGIKVIIPIMAIHYDADYFPDPYTFDPERFNLQNKANIVKGSYIPFGDGPKICIGQRLAKMEIKVALVTLLMKYTFFVNKKMIQPITFSPRAIFLVPKHQILLDVIPRENC